MTLSILINLNICITLKLLEREIYDFYVHQIPVPCYLCKSVQTISMIHQVTIKFPVYAGILPDPQQDRHWLKYIIMTEQYMHITYCDSFCCFPMLSEFSQQHRLSNVMDANKHQIHTIIFFSPVNILQKMNYKINKQEVHGPHLSPKK